MKGKHILVITNISREQPGILLEIFTERSWRTTIVNLDLNETFPSPLLFDGLVVMGGPSSANDSKNQTSWMPEEIDKIRQALHAGVPYFGVCLGLQTLLKAAGGDIIKSPRKEVGFRESYTHPIGGFYTVTSTKEGRLDPLLFGLPETMHVFHLHGEAVVIHSAMTYKATLLATAPIVPNQIVKVGKNAYGTQGHFELTHDILQNWLTTDPDLLSLKQNGIEQIWKDYTYLQSEYSRNARKLFHNFCEIV